MWNRMYQLFFIFTNSMDGGKKNKQNHSNGQQSDSSKKYVKLNN